MEVTGFLGDVGSGKTASMVRYAYSLYEDGHPIYGNITLKFPYVEMHNTNWAKVQNNAVFLLDEIGLGGAQATNRLRALEETLAQGRKALGEHGYVLYTTQLVGFLSSNLRSLTNYIIYPELIRDKKTNKPIKARWMIFKRSSFIPFFGQFLFKKSVMVDKLDEILELYDTTEIVKRISGGDYEKYANMYGKEYGMKDAPKAIQNKAISELMIKLEKYEGVNTTKAKRLATSIVLEL